jgi:hypothetical protein
MNAIGMTTSSVIASNEGDNSTQGRLSVLCSLDCILAKHHSSRGVSIAWVLELG